MVEEDVASAQVWVPKGKLGVVENATDGDGCYGSEQVPVAYAPVMEL
jgi:hypothetical protein